MGSSNSSYQLVWLQSSVWAELAKSCSVPGKLVDAVNSHPWGKLAVGNARFARVQCEVACEMKLFVMEAANPSVADAMLIRAASAVQQLR